MCGIQSCFIVVLGVHLYNITGGSMAEWLGEWETLAMMKLWSARGREIEPRPGHYIVG